MNIRKYRIPMRKNKYWSPTEDLLGKGKGDFRQRYYKQKMSFKKKYLARHTQLSTVCLRNEREV